MIKRAFPYIRNFVFIFLGLQLTFIVVRYIFEWKTSHVDNIVTFTRPVYETLSSVEYRIDTTTGDEQIWLGSYHPFGQSWSIGYTWACQCITKIYKSGEYYIYKASENNNLWHQLPNDRGTLMTQEELLVYIKTAQEVRTSIRSRYSDLIREIETLPNFPTPPS